MRNYVQTFFCKIDFEDPFASQFTLYIVDASPAACADSIAIVSADLAANGYVNISGSQLGPRYYCLDKTNFINVLVNVGAGTLWNFPIPPEFSGTGTPRNGWTDIDGTPRKPPPSENKALTAKNSKAGVQSMSLFGYLDRLVAKWDADHEPQRWIEWLAQLRDLYGKGRISAPEVYGFLFRVDFAARVIKLPSYGIKKLHR